MCYCIETFPITRVPMNEDHKSKKETRFFKTVKMLNGTHSNAWFIFELLGSLMDTTQNDHWNLQE